MPKYDAVVADASPLISLEKLPAGFSLLPHTCSQLLVPEAVAQEVAAILEKGVDYFDLYDVRRFVGVEIIPSGQISLEEWPGSELELLGEGEKYALALAKEADAPLLAEERKARSLAREGGLRVFGAAAMIKIAVEQGGIQRQHGIELLRALLRAHRINRKVFERMRAALQ